MTTDKPTNQPVLVACPLLFVLEPMEKQHLTYFKIENFKRFDSFEMSNLGQFNLIVGDNNVGKTSVLEGLLFNEDIKKFIGNFSKVFLNRDKNGIHYGYNTDIAKFWNYTLKFGDKPLKFYTDSQTQPFLTAYLTDSESIDLNSSDYLLHKVSGIIPKSWIKLHNSETDNSQSAAAYFEDAILNPVELPFISVNTSYDDDLVSYFYLFFNENKQVRRELEDNLKLIIPNLEEIRIHRFYIDRDLIGLSIANDDSLQPLTRYGDGTVKIFRLLMEIIVNQDRRFMVDEIGSGIHFTRLTNYWKTIIQLCGKYNVQLFATTHSLECQQAFIEALEDSEMQQYQKDARNISLIENKQGEVKAITYDFEQFEYALNIGFNTRGGKR